MAEWLERPPRKATLWCKCMGSNPGQPGEKIVKYDLTNQVKFELSTYISKYLFTKPMNTEWSFKLIIFKCHQFVRQILPRDIRPQEKSIVLYFSSSVSNIWYGLCHVFGFYTLSRLMCLSLCNCACSLLLYVYICGVNTLASFQEERLLWNVGQIVNVTCMHTHTNTVYYLPFVFENGGRYCFGFRRRIRRLRGCFALYLRCY